jgi:hypothetical protein
MVAAAYTLSANEPKLQRGAAVWTVQLLDTHRAAPVAKHHELLAEDFDPMRQVAQLVNETNRLPKATHILAAGVSGST